MSETNYKLKTMEQTDFDAVISLGNQVHGDGYLSLTSLTDMLKKSIKDDINGSFVLYDDKNLIGFRISYAPGQWQLDQWCTPEQWQIPSNKAAYFKCNTIHPDYQGQGLGGLLLSTSIDALKKMGAEAGVSHIWMQSPGNASFKYFTKAGGILIKEHKDRWANDPTLPNYNCVICGSNCHCTASEMILVFK